MKIIYFGSAAIGFPTLEKLLASEHELLAAVTQPDRPAGRRRRLTLCPVKQFALDRKIPVLSPENAADAYTELTALNADLFVVVAYGQYIPQSIRELPAHGAINLHPSLLPKYRGSSPIQWAIANGDTVTGVSIIYVAKKMDAGDVLLQKKYPIAPDDTAATLEPRLAELGGDLMLQAISQICAGTNKPVPQDENSAVEVRKLSKEDGIINWNLPAETIRNRIRAFQPWPGVSCELPNGERLKILCAAVESGSGAPGEIININSAGPLVATGGNALRMLEVQPAGKKSMDAAAWLRGHTLSVGGRLR
ncbi:MAG: methionyl-tRNA formyltransferase [Kiritimatiellales bacterium]